MAGWLTEHWQAPLWITDKEWLHARMNTTSGEDAALQRRDFARRAGLDDEDSAIFAERQGNYRRGVPSVPPAYHRIAEGSVIEIGGRDWRVLIGEGHAPEHACLFCEETGVLIAGDQILPRISPNISVQAYEPDGDPLARYLASLKKLRGAVAARHSGAAVAQSAVPRRPPAHRRAGGASRRALRRGAGRLLPRR